ncbi:hypothetical protein SISSUDRAFT_1038435 [Sistotremastrum suecicum HHB10207 ss-3]|uniref:Uncharacterized protein n=1 Tax=Sistotremastrum suecicum HHB10207 ss-3 TaxID=1314776 RepID=A0A165WR41_9AGAM|nr:hypothetical protein SISSUDRAFT_1038435 [Sistotremastrum suecicum HHB10207 ss-3]
MPYPDLDRVLRGEVTGPFSCIALGRQIGQIAAVSIQLHFRRHFLEWEDIRDLFRRFNVMFTLPMAQILEDLIRGRVRVEDDTVRMHCYVHHACVGDIVEELVAADQRWELINANAMPLGHHDGWVGGDVRGIWCLAPVGGDPNRSHLTIYGVQHIVHEGPIYQFVQCDCDREDTGIIARMRGRLDWAVDGYRRHLSEGRLLVSDEFYIHMHARRAPRYLLP